MKGVNRLRAAVSDQVGRQPLRLAEGAAVATISFDDVPPSAFENGLPILERAEVRATWYVCGALSEQRGKGLDPDQLLALRDAGHEIGCHTWAHEKISRLSPAQLRASLERNRDFFQDLLGGAPRSFSYPNGSLAPWHKTELAARFSSARSTAPGRNSDGVDRLTLRAEKLYEGRIDAAQLRRMAEETKRDGGWLILYSHDVQERPSSIGCTPSLLEVAVAAIQDAGIELKTVEQICG